MNFKKVIAKIAAVIMISTMSTTTLAQSPQVEIPISISCIAISPYWNNISDITVAISSSGKTLYPEAIIKAQNSSSKITGSLCLEKYTYGRWSLVTSWPISGTGSVIISETFTGVSGTKYRARAIVIVGSEEANAPSNSCIL